MSRTLKILTVAIGALLLLVVAAVVLVSSIDANGFRDDIRRLAAEQAGLDLAISGDLDWSLFPRISLSVADTSAAWLQADGTPGEPLARIGALQLDAALWPLLSTSPRLEITGVHLADAELTLLRRADGSTNWEPPEAPPPADDAGGGAPALSVLRASITDARLRYEDRTTGTLVTLDDLDLEAAPQLLPLSVPVQLGFALSAPEDVRGELALVVRREDGQLLVDDLRGDGRWASTAGNLPWRLRGSVLLLDAGARLQGLAASLGELTVQLDGQATAEALDLRVQVPTTNPTAVLHAFDPSLPDPGEIALAMQVRGSPEDLQISGLDASLPGGRWSGSARVRNPADGAMALELSLASERLDLGALAALAPAEAPAAAAPAATATSAAPAGGSGGSTASGSVAGASGNNPLPAPRPEDAAALPLLPLAVADLPAWQADVAIGELLLPDGLTLGGVALTSRHGDDRLAADIKVQRLFGGTTTADLAITQLAGEPRWTIATTARDVQAREILAWLGQTPDLVAGLRADGNYTARGRSLGDVLDTVTGELTFDGGQGQLDIRRFKQQVLAVATLTGKTDKVARWPDILDYQRLTGRVAMTGVDDQQVSLRLDNLEADATGGIAWRAGTMDYRAQVVVRDHPDYSSFDLNEYLVGVAFPVRCAGALDAESLCSVDQQRMQQVVADILTGSANQAVQERLDRAIEEKVPEEFRDAAKGLLDMLRQGRKGGG